MMRLRDQERPVHHLVGMPPWSERPRILLVRSWLEPLGPLRAALRAHGIDIELTRVDFEPALNAALARGGFSAIVFDPRTRGLTREVLDARVREHCRFFIPVIVLDGDEGTAALLLGQALAELRN